MSSLGLNMMTSVITVSEKARNRVMPDLPELSKAEFEIMKIIWEEDNLTTGELLQKVNDCREEPVKRATLQVQLRRLQSKGWLKRRKKGNAFLFYAVAKKDKSFLDIALDIKDRVCEGSITNFISCLFENDKLSKSEIKELKKLLAESDHE